MSDSGSVAVASKRNPLCKTRLRGISPRACNLIREIPEFRHGDVEVTNAYRQGAVKVLEMLAPECQHA